MKLTLLYFLDKIPDQNGLMKSLNWIQRSSLETLYRDYFVSKPKLAYMFVICMFLHTMTPKFQISYVPQPINMSISFCISSFKAATNLFYDSSLDFSLNFRIYRHGHGFVWLCNDIMYDAQSDEVCDQISLWRLVINLFFKSIELGCCYKVAFTSLLKCLCFPSHFRSEIYWIPTVF